MFCKGIVMYKGLETRDGGTFKNEKGESINYDKSYVVKFDEMVDNKINERKLKFPDSNKILADKFQKFEPYTKVKIYCNVVMTNSICKLVPIDVTDDLDDTDDEEDED